ncbi:hypothetical protein EKK58_04470 [Candidatus Dependentiae bacterium]|nr:MAG: hypothetical protein EKK58_04470 [Candidatus Dependentiae bacterium]
MVKNGFLLFSFTIYLALYIFLCGLISHFSFFYLQSLHEIQRQSRVFFAYYNTQQIFIRDCLFCINVSLDDNKIIIYKKNYNIIWRLKKHSLVREELYGKDKKKVLVYLCTNVDMFKPFLRECNMPFSFVGFEVRFFSFLLTIFAIAQKGE